MLNIKKKIVIAMIITLLFPFSNIASGGKDLDSIDNLTKLSKIMKETKIEMDDVKGGDPKGKDFTKLTDEIIVFTENGNMFAFKKSEGLRGIKRRESAYLLSGEIVLDVKNGQINNVYGKIENKWIIGAFMKGKDGGLYFVRRDSNGKFLSIKILEIKDKSFKVGNEIMGSK